MKESLKKYWPTISITIINWIIFVLLLASVTMVYLVKDREVLVKQRDVCRNNLAEFEKQVDSGRIILELKDGGGTDE